MPNYVRAFQQAAYLFVTHSLWGGWHHVEVHKSDWWQDKLEAHGFVYSEHLTKRAREMANQGSFVSNHLPCPACVGEQLRSNLCFPCKDVMPGEGPGGTELYYRSQHLWLALLVFVNPRVASLDKHAHLLGGGNDVGCTGKGGTTFYPCTGEDELPPRFRSLPLTPEQDDRWHRLAFANPPNKSLQRVRPNQPLPWGPRTSTSAARTGSHTEGKAAKPKRRDWFAWARNASGRA